MQVDCRLCRGQDQRMYLRAYRTTDFEALYALDVVCFASQFRFSRKMMRAVTQSRDAIVRLACEEDQSGQERLLGFGVMNVEHSRVPRQGYVATLDVAPESRGKGVGRFLMLALESAAAAGGVRRVFLHVFSENLVAIRLYRQLGYRELARLTDFYGVGLDALAFQKQLLPAT